MSANSENPEMPAESLDFELRGGTGKRAFGRIGGPVPAAHFRSRRIPA